MTGGRTLTVRWLGLTPYEEASALQRMLAEQLLAGQIGNQLLLLEHPPVYTMGRGGEARHLGAGPDALRAAGAEYHDVDRGGSVTFHGPGQLVAYPILKLADVVPIPQHSGHGDVLRYVRGLEQAAIGTAARFGVAAEPRPPYTGVWIGTQKLAAIGVKLAAGVSRHGLAMNVCIDLSWFDLITPCGIDDASVTSLRALGVADVTPRDVAPVLAGEIARAFGLRLARREVGETPAAPPPSDPPITPQAA